MLTTFYEFVIGNTEGCKTLARIPRRNPAFFSCKAFLAWMCPIINHPNVCGSLLSVNRNSQNYSNVALMTHWKGIVPVKKTKQNKKPGCTWKLLESIFIANYKQILVNTLNKKRGRKQEDLGHRQADERILVAFHLRLLRCIPVFNYLRRCDIPLREIRRSEGMAVSCIFLLIALWNWFSRNSLNCNRVWGQTVTTDSNHWVKIIPQTNNNMFWWNKSSERAFECCLSRPTRSTWNNFWIGTKGSTCFVTMLI